MNLEARKPGKDLSGPELRDRVIGCAIRVHTELGPGFLESVYEEALVVEFRHSGLQVERQKPVPIFIAANRLENIASICWSNDALSSN